MSDVERATILILAGTYVVLLAVGLFTTARRWLRFRRYTVAVPRLLRRDVILLAGHAIPVVLALGALAVGMRITTAPLAWWVAFVVPPLIGIGVYVWYEVAVLG